MQIFKYRLNVQDHFQQVEVPKGGEIVHVGNQENILSVWINVDPESPLECRVFWTVGTGQDIPKASRYVGTAMIGRFVWHVFEAV